MDVPYYLHEKCIRSYNKDTLKWILVLHYFFPSFQEIIQFASRKDVTVVAGVNH